MRAFRARQSIDGFVDLSELANPEPLRHQGQRAIIRGHYEVTAAGTHHDAAPLGADAGIHHRYEHRPFRPVIEHGVQPVGGLPDVERGNLVRQVLEHEGRIDLACDAAHRGDGVIFQPEIALKYHDCAGGVSRVHSEHEGERKTCARPA